MSYELALSQIDPTSEIIGRNFYREGIGYGEITMAAFPDEQVVRSVIFFHDAEGERQLFTPSRDFAEEESYGLYVDQLGSLEQVSELVAGAINAIIIQRRQDMATRYPDTKLGQQELQARFKEPDLALTAGYPLLSSYS